MITIEIVVLDVRRAEEAGKYAVELTINGVNKVFEFGVSPRSDTGLVSEDDFEAALSGVLGVRRIATLVTNFHKGQQLDLPLAFQAFKLERGDKPPSLG